MSTKIQPPIAQSEASIEFDAKFINIASLSGHRLYRVDRQAFDCYLESSVDAETLGFWLSKALVASKTYELAEIGNFFDRDVVKAYHDKWATDMIQRYGYKSRRALFKSLMHCSCVKRGGTIEIMPTQKGPGESWVGIGDSGAHVFLPESCTVRELGEGLRLAMSRCI